MNTISMSLVVAVTTVMAVIPLTRCGAADEVVAFGLTNQSINSAAIFLDLFWLNNPYAQIFEPYVPD